ncbi:MAG: cereblon family protein [Gammaproteobacteria bacterium]|nr:cereblon family protein [Gammaproteobacteria bacterium]
MQVQYCLQKQTRRHLPERQTNESISELGRDQQLCCIDCGNVITAMQFAIEHLGKQRHFVQNAAGEQYHIALYEQAFGCGIAGVPTTDFTWFPPHSWRFAYCRRCRLQLGWQFSGRKPFFALIERLLKACDE